jgi:hypothetical protein
LGITPEQKKKILDAILAIDEERVRIANEMNNSVTLGIQLSSVQNKLTSIRENLAILLIPEEKSDPLDGPHKI